MAAMAAAGTAFDNGAAVDAWFAAECDPGPTEESVVLSHIPGLLAVALERVVEDAAVASALEAAECAPFFRRWQGAARSARSRRARTSLHGVHAPQIGLRAYAARLLKYLKCSPVCFVAAWCFMTRLEASGALRVDALCAHRLLIAGVVLAAKFYDDRCGGARGRGGGWSLRTARYWPRRS